VAAKPGKRSRTQSRAGRYETIVNRAIEKSQAVYGVTAGLLKELPDEGIAERKPPRQAKRECGGACVNLTEEVSSDRIQELSNSDISIRSRQAHDYTSTCHASTK